MAERPSPSYPASSIASSSSTPDIAVLDLITELEKQVMVKMDSRIDHLQSLPQDGSLDQDSLRGEMNRVSQLAQALLLLRFLPALLSSPPDKGNDKGGGVQRADRFKNIPQAAETPDPLCQDQNLQAIDEKASEIRKQIQIREQQIRSQIAQKQQAIAQIINDKTHRTRLG